MAKGRGSDNARPGDETLPWCRLVVAKDAKGAKFETGGVSGLLLFVQAKPGSARDALLGLAADGAALRVAVRARPVEGEANLALAVFLARLLGVPRGSVRLERGATARQKTFFVESDSPEELVEALRSALASGTRTSSAY